MSVHRRKNSPYYYAEFQIRGQRFLRSTGCKSEREALAEERRLRALALEEIEKAAKSQGMAALTLSQAFGAYWEKEAHKLAPAWRNEVKRYGTHILTRIDGGIQISDVTDAEVDRFVQEHYKGGGGKYALNRALAVWRRVHNLARKRWKQNTHEIDWAEFKNAEAKRKRSLTQQEAARLIEISPADLKLAIQWSLLTGTRKSETFGLEWEKVDLPQRKCTVIAKGGREHTVWLNDDALALVASIPRRGRYVFAKVNWRRQWDACVKRAGIDDFCWHDLRHTHATWLRQAGVPLEVVQRSLGHADLATTTRYAHVADHELQDALHKLPSLNHITTNIVSIKQVKSAR